MKLRLIALSSLFALVAAGCGSDSKSASTTTTTTTTTTSAAPTSSTTPPPPDVLRILVTDDDGVGAPAIDVMVNELSKLQNVEVTIVAPKDNKSGTGDQLSATAPTAEPATTASGVTATAVNGFPADTVNYALDALGVKPHVVVSGSNKGQNIGTVVGLSGTIGAARQAIRRGIPAVAASQGLAENPAYEVSVGYVIAWITEHRDELIAGTADNKKLVSFNAPTCATGAVRGLVTVPVAQVKDGRELSTSDCESTMENPKDDVDAFANGFATQSSFAPEDVPPLG
ncbi:MAG: 5'/3'-nucleotidase SurE [Acidimicrobiia bacterium]